MIELMFTGLSTALVVISGIFGAGHAHASVHPSASASLVASAHDSAKLSQDESASSTLVAGVDSVANITSQAAANLASHLSLPGLALGAHAHGGADLESNE